MSLKYFEIRDAGTFMPVMCVGMSSDDPAESFLIRRAGFVRGQVLMTPLNTLKTEYNFGHWEAWLGAVHKYIIEHWSTLKTGQVIDMQHVRGESEKPRISERLENDKLYAELKGTT